MGHCDRLVRRPPRTGEGGDRPRWRERHFVPLGMIWLILATLAGVSASATVAMAEAPTAVIQGRYVGTPAPAMLGASEAVARAAEAVVAGLAPDGSLQSEGLDLTGCIRSWTWDLLFAVALLGGAEDDAFERALDGLLARQRPDGAWPVMRCVGSPAGSPGDNVDPDSSSTAGAVAVLAGLLNRAHPLVNPASVRPALANALAWMETVWIPDLPGAYAIAPGSPQASTEGTALALMAGIELEAVFPGCCRARNVAAANLLASVKAWHTDHFARGFSKNAVDADATGPHTHQGLAVLALAKAARAYPGETPAMSCCNPLPWLRRHFTRATTSAGRVVQGLGDRLVLWDDHGLLYGCDGGQLGPNPAELVCPPGTVRRADPGERCYSPYDGCAVPVGTIPSSATPVPAVNAEITLLSALAALLIGSSPDTKFLLNGALALQRPEGGVIAIAGPREARPGIAMLYPDNHRVIQRGYTALLGLALLRLDPFSYGQANVSIPLPRLRFPQDRFDPSEPVLTALLPDPLPGKIKPIAGGLKVVHQARPEGWVRAYMPVAQDLPFPTACYRLQATISGSGWPDYEIVTTTPDGLTHGRRIQGALSGAGRPLDIPLKTLGLFWPRELDTDDDPPVMAGLGHAQDDSQPGHMPAGALKLKLKGLRLAADDCIEGGIPTLRLNRVAVDGASRPPSIRDDLLMGEPALRVDFSLDGDNPWQRVIAHDRWRWTCVTALVLRYSVNQPTGVQIVLTDAQTDGLTGARWVANITLQPTGRWSKWTVPLADLAPFAGELRPLDLARVRQVAVAIVSTAGASDAGTVFLDKLKPLAPITALAADGTCLTTP